MLDKFRLKQNLIELADIIEKKVGAIMNDAASEEAGEIRARVYQQAKLMHDMLEREIYNIY